MKTLSVICLLFSLFILSCEKEIDINLPKPVPELVVEASINDRFPTLNYVYLTQTLDYFNLDLNLEGVSGALVYITEGIISGTDTIYNESTKTRMFEVVIPMVPSGFYINPLLNPVKNKVYKLEVWYKNKFVKGVTYIYEPIYITKADYSFRGENDGTPRARLSISFFDPKEPSFYRIAYTVGKDSNLLGWGASERLRLLNDQTQNNQVREYNSFQDFRTGDTVDVYLGRIGRNEYNFWDSFLAVRNSDGPFSTPAQVRSNIKGGIGSFCGYSIDYKRIIIR